MEIDPKLFALHGHWATADAVRYALFHVSNDPAEAAVMKELGPELGELARLQSTMFRLSVFYGLLYVVVEGYREVGQPSEAIDKLLEEDHVNRLRLFRNAVFHYQKEPISPKLLGFLTQPESEVWIKKLHREFEKYLRERLPIESQLEKFRISTGKAGA
jgi:hypothetical protein